MGTNAVSCDRGPQCSGHNARWSRFAGRYLSSQSRRAIPVAPHSYGKAHQAPFGYAAAAEGYVVVVQDVRGRYDSDGEWYPFKHETLDGYDTVEWAAALPFSNGKVGMFGGSYPGATQMLAAVGHPPHLAGICPYVTAADYHDGWTYQGGAFEQWFSTSWASELAADTLDKRVLEGTNALKYAATLPLANYTLFDVPPTAGHRGLAALATYYLDWLSHPASMVTGSLFPSLRTIPAYAYRRFTSEPGMTYFSMGPSEITLGSRN